MGRPRKGWSLRDPREPNDPYTVRFTDKAGRPRELTTGTRDPREAARVAADLYARDLTSSGGLVRPRVDPLLKLDELMAMWLVDLAASHDEDTIEQYTRDARRLAAHFGNTLANVTVGRMADYQRARLAKVLKRTVQKERSSFNTFLGWCVEQGVLDEANVPTWPKIPKKATGVRSGPQRAKPVDVTREQVGAFLEELPIWSRPRRGFRHAIRPRFIVAYETGLRPGTLDELRVPQHWKPGQTFLTIEDRHDKARFGREVPISRLAVAALEYVVAELRLTDGLIFGEHDYRWAVDDAAQRAGLPEDFAPYDLRHGRVGHMLDETGDVRAVMFLVGHLLMTTTNRYVRGQAERSKATIAAMEAGEFRGDIGEKRMLGEGAKEEGRTPTGVTPPEPESGAQAPDRSSYADVDGQARTKTDTFGQGFGDTPETQIPKSVADAARFLAVLRATDDAIERALADDLIGGGA